MPESNGTYVKFRLNFEQQGKRAKELLKAARAGEREALARFKSEPRLAEAQYLIARDLRFENWAALKRHISDMDVAREVMSASVLDGDLKTLHVRCGHDLQASLQDAGFRGDYYVHSYPYLFGPVREGEGCLEERARFIVECYGDDFDPPLDYDGQLRALIDNERELAELPEVRERVVLWFEHDCTDQLALIRLLGHYAKHRRPPRLELISIDDFPGSGRFIGLGELPPEALRMLWATRKPARPSQLQLGLKAWRALANPDPRPLAAIMRSNTPALPLLAFALHRHLRELPSRLNGLSLTEELALTSMAERPQTLNEIYRAMMTTTDPLPGQGDGHVARRVLAMEAASAPLFTRTPAADQEGNARSPWSDVFAITELGRSVLRGEIDFRSLDPPSRWVSGVHIAQANPDWRWNERAKDVALYPS